MSEGQLALLRELASADEVLAGDLGQLESLAARTAAVRERAGALLDLFGGADAKRVRLGRELALAEADVAERKRVLEAAGAELAGATEKADPERMAAAKRFETRARDALAVARRRLDSLRAEREEFEERVRAAEQEAPEVEASAASLAETLSGRPRLAEEAGRQPADGLPGVIEWAGSARAALFVARTAVGTEREALIRQANELGSAMLGEPLSAVSPAVVLAAVERTSTS